MSKLNQERIERLAANGIIVSKAKPKYQQAVEWIAFNDEDAILDLDYIREMITVQLIAEIFSKNADKVGQDVYNFRVANN